MLGKEVNLTRFNYTTVDISLICWLDWLSMSFVQSFLRCAFSLATTTCWLVGQDLIFFDLLILANQVQCYSSGLPLGVSLFYYLHDCQFWQWFVLLAADPVQVVVS